MVAETVPPECVQKSCVWWMDGETGVANYCQLYLHGRFFKKIILSEGNKSMKCEKWKVAEGSELAGDVC
jgi:hypothetical protein